MPGSEWANKNFQVREEVARIEAKTRMEDQPNKIDLRDWVLKTKNKMKTKVCPLLIEYDPILKNKKNKKFLPQQGQPSLAPAKRDILPLKEFYIDDIHYNSEGLEIY